MPKMEVRHPDKTVSTGSYSAGILIDGWVFVSGQGPIDMRTGEVVAGTIEEETRLTLSHVEQILKAAGCTRHDVVKCTVHLADINDFNRFDRAYAEFFTGVRPARTTVQSVLSRGIRIEIDATARVPSG
jgi:2-iminobutanoate/2-iminopropanoate deaminase